MNLIDVSSKTPLLAGLSPQTFMRLHWQKKPLLIRNACPGIGSLVQRSDLFALAAREEVESRLIVRQEPHWRLRHGPLPRRALPPLSQPGWTLLVQGLDLHLDAARELLSQFRFVPDARLDDVMVSWASDQGGVGAHVDSYDVFLLQVQGTRRWRIGPVGEATLLPDAPLKVLQGFVAQDEWLLQPGDMLYLPPGVAHEGVAIGECMTASIGFRAPARAALGHEVMQRCLDAVELPERDVLYRDPAQAASIEPARIPQALQRFAADEIARWLRDPQALACALGEVLSEPKPLVAFDASDAAGIEGGIELDRRTRMLYDDRHVFINGESFRAGGRDARLMRQLADQRKLPAKQCQALSADAAQCLKEWMQAGWLRPLNG